MSLKAAILGYLLCFFGAFVGIYRKPKPAVAL